MKYDSLVLANEKAKVGIQPEGGYVTSWQTIDDNGVWKDILYVGSSIKRSGIPILFPYFGKAEKWPQHGFGRNSTWRVVEQTETWVVMELKNADISEEVMAWYPYNFVTKIIVEVSEEGELLYSLQVENVGDQAMPISPGVHPYWKTDHTAKKNILIDGVEDFDASSFDWENVPPDNVYSFVGNAVVHLSAHDVVIEELSDESVIKHVVIWSQTPVRDPDFDFVCVEPTTGWNYAIDRTPILVAPNDQWEMKLRFSVNSK